jgi:hypothetical protein
LRRGANYKNSGRREGNPGQAILHKAAEGVGFEPTVGLHLLRFSRPSQSTTLAPLPWKAMLMAGTSYGAGTFGTLLLTYLVDDVVGDEYRHIDSHS